MSRNASCGTCSSKAGRVRQVVIEPFLIIARRINIPFVIKFKMVSPTLNWRRGGGDRGYTSIFPYPLLPVPALFWWLPPFSLFDCKTLRNVHPPPTSILCTFFFRFLVPFSSLMCSHSHLLTPAFSLASGRFFWS